jgi:hypothetical protein
MIKIKITNERKIIYLPSAEMGIEETDIDFWESENEEYTSWYIESDDSGKLEEDV